MTEKFIPKIEIKETIDQRPYVVSADIKLVLEDWAKLKGFTLPSDDFFAELRQESSSYMTGIFPGFELVSEESLQGGLSSLVEETRLFPISLDPVYFKSPAKLAINRLMENPQEKSGLGR